MSLEKKYEYEKILVFDNYDSFTYNIVHLVRELGYETEVYRNDKITLDEIGRYDKIILSPGPGLPCESGLLPELLYRYAAEKSILGICLGEQAIGECFGAHLRNLDKVYHGIATPVRIIGSRPFIRRIGRSYGCGTLSFVGSGTGRFTRLSRGDS